MGTSKRNLNTQIKKLLIEKPLDQLNDAAPEASKIVLRQEVLRKTLQDERAVNTLISVVGKSFDALSTYDFNGKTKDEIREDELTQQEFMETVIKKIEDSNNTISTILEKSLKTVLTELLNKGTYNAYEFSHLLFYQVIYRLLSNELYETLKDSYQELPYSQVDKMVISVTDNIINDNVYSKINEFVDKKISLGDLLKIITTATDNAKFGDF